MFSKTIQMKIGWHFGVKGWSFTKYWSHQNHKQWKELTRYIWMEKGHDNVVLKGQIRLPTLCKKEEDHVVADKEAEYDI